MTDEPGSNASDLRWRSIYDFWFPAGLAEADLETHRRMHAWWLRGGANAEILRFAPLVERAAKGELDRWAEVPLGRLSLIIVLDQFPRGLYAGTPAAFALDPKALALTEEGLGNDHYEAMSDYWQRTFFILPLIHAEGPDHLARADRAVALTEMHLADGPAHLLPIREFGLGQARSHRDVVARFGRHPHRNAILSRASTPEEVLYIETAKFVHQRLPYPSSHD